MAEYKIPVTKATLDKADTADIVKWLGIRVEELDTGAGDPKFENYNRGWITAARAELAKRGVDTAAPKGNGAAKSNGKAAPAANASAAPKAAPSAALAVRGSDKLAGTFNDAAEASERLRQAASQFILIAPATDVGMLPEGCGVALSFVHIDTTAVQGKYGNTYPAGDVNEIAGKLMLTATALKRIAAAAQIDWDTAESGRTDDRSNPHYCSWVAVGWVKNFDGTRRRVSGNADIDTTEDGAGHAIGAAAVEIRTKAEKRRRDKPDWDNDGGDSQLLELRKFLPRQTETKAKNRAIADLGVPRSLTKEQLQKPFAVARLIWTGQTKDPELKRIFAEKQFDVMHGVIPTLYGRAQQPPAPAFPSPSYSIATTGHVTDDDNDEASVPTYAMSEAATPPKTEGSAANEQAASPEPSTNNTAAGPSDPATKPDAKTDAKPPTQPKLTGLTDTEDRGANPNDY